MRQPLFICVMMLSPILSSCSIGMDAFYDMVGGGNAVLEPSVSLRFDVTPVTGVYSEESLFVVATEDKTVEVADVWLEGPDRASFHLNAIELPIYIAPNQDAELLIGFTTDYAGQHDATLFVQLGEVDGDPLIVKVEGMGCLDNNMDQRCDPN